MLNIVTEAGTVSFLSAIQVFINFFEWLLPNAVSFTIAMVIIDCFWCFFHLFADYTISIQTV